MRWRQRCARSSRTCCASRAANRSRTRSSLLRSPLPPPEAGGIDAHLHAIDLRRFPMARGEVADRRPPVRRPLDDAQFFEVRQRALDDMPLDVEARDQLVLDQPLAWLSRPKMMSSSSACAIDRLWSADRVEEGARSGMVLTILSITPVQCRRGRQGGFARRCAASVARSRCLAGCDDEPISVQARLPHGPEFPGDSCCATRRWIVLRLTLSA